ncbi:FtsB family cell division protein [Allofustis seminis]|uniref:FtsB family cell division protein n=1 Tax=Allofustis seminis TaxID=166939 RepID=UPI000376E4DF|nr:septum formation initiator family protein [Allofustis seminis]
MKDTPKVTTLHEQYTKEKTLANIREQKRARFIHMRKTAIMVLGCLALLFTSWPLVKNHQKTVEYRQQYKESQEQLAQLKEEKDNLEYQVTLLENDEYVAKLARSEYHLTKDNEVVFKLPNKSEESEVEQQNKEEKQDDAADDTQE